MSNRTVKVTIRADIQNYLKEMDRVSRKTEETATAADKLASKRQAYEQLGKGLMAYGAGVTAIGVAMLKTGIEYNSLQQKTRASLTTMLGSAKAANAQMDKLDAFARTSPFAKQTFIRAQQQMLAFGIESRKVVPYLEAIQDAVAAAGGSNAEIERIVATMSKIQASSKITAQDLNEFGNAGINAAELIGSQMGMTGAQIREAITAGSLDATQALDALAAGMSERFGGAAANVKETFEGAVDRVKAAWRDLSASLAEPLVSSDGGGWLVDGLNKLADFMRMMEALPEPVKIAAAAAIGLSGAIALVAGAMFLAVPRVAEYNRNIQHMPQLFQRMDAGARAVGRGIKSIGWARATLAVTALTTAIMIYSHEKAAQKARVDAFKNSLDEETGALTENTREIIANESAQSRWYQGFQSTFDYFETLGVSAQTVTDALMGNTEAIKQVEEATHRATDSRNLWLGAFDREYQLQQRAWEAYQRTKNELDESVDLHHLLEDAVSGSNDEMGKIPGLADDAADGMEEVASAAEVQAQAVDDAVNALKNYGNELAGVAVAELDALDALAKLDDQLEKNGKTLDRNTQKGRDNERYLIDLAGALRRANQEEFELNVQTMGLDAAIDQLGKSTDLSREEFVAAARQFVETDKAAEDLADQYFVTGDQAMGAARNTDGYRESLKRQEQQAEETRQKVQQYGRNLGGLPKEVNTLIRADTSTAQFNIDDFVRRNYGRTIKINVSTSSRAPDGTNVGMFARGGMISYASGRQIQAFSGGGFPTGIYKGGPPIHKFAEPETRWEAYISGKPGLESRNIQIALEALKRLGYHERAFAGGGLVTGERYTSHIPRSSSATPVAVPTVNVTAVVDDDSVRYLAGETRAGIRDLFSSEAKRSQRDGRVR